MPKSSGIAAIVFVLAFSMAPGGQPMTDWTNVRGFFRQQVADAGIVGASQEIRRTLFLKISRFKPTT